LLDYSLILATTSGGISGFNADHFVIDTRAFLNAPGSTNFSITTVGNNLVLNYAVVPEPSTGVLAFAAVAGIALRRRRG
jgi:hypothetical protein